MRRRSVDRMPTDPPATLAGWLRTRSDEQLSALLAARPDVARPGALRHRRAGQPARGAGLGGPRARRAGRRRRCRCSTSCCSRPTDGVPPERPGRRPARPARRRRSPAGLDRADHPGAAVGRRRPARPRPGPPRGPPPGGPGPPRRRPAGAAAGRPAGRPRRAGPRGARRPRAAGRRPARSGHLPDAPQTAARRRPAGCCSAGCWPGSTRSTSSCPREIGLLLRGDRPVRPAAAAARAGRRPPATEDPVDRQAAGAALESVGRVAELLALLEEEPAGLLRSGGVGVRDQKRLARTLHVAEPDAAWLLELALRRRAARRRRAAPRRVAAHPRLRHLARAGPARPLGGAGRRAG